MHRPRSRHLLAALLVLAAAVAAPPLVHDKTDPRLAIIIDDLGYDRATADALSTVPFPLTASVLPNLQHSTEAATVAHASGHQVLLHVPMESYGVGVAREAVGLRTGMSAEKVDALVAAMLATVPHAVGASNHQGSRATADRALMDALMAALRKRGLFFIDSRTTTETVAVSAAASAGVPAASRKVFLDNVLGHRAILAQLDLAAGEARRNGPTIAIGHPHPATFAALGDGLRRVQAQGIRLVHAGDVVQ